MKQSHLALPVLPENLRALHDLAINMYWVWNHKIREVFETADPAAWAGVGHNPIALLQKLGRPRIDELAKDEGFVSLVKEAHDLQAQYLHDRKGTWFNKTYGILDRPYLVAYFSAEYGIDSCLRTYSGGLGVLSGDHLKSASDLGIPLVGVGLFYKRGYFAQNLTHDGWQVESYPENDPNSLPIEPVLEKDSQEPLIISVPLGERQVRVRAWRVSVGRVPLYLLDTNLPGLNSKEDCDITGELYGGDIETRIRQEIVLGFAGAKLLSALGLRPSVVHMNEGHSAFVTLERIREVMEESSPGSSFSQARQIVRSTSIFTTHTPVPAGIDVFPCELLERYLGYYHKRVGISQDDSFALGQEKPDSHVFNMAVLAIRLSSDVNAVSKLHQEVARKLWENTLSEQSFDTDDGNFKGSGKISHVTNGIHLPSWVSDSMAGIYDEYLGVDWAEHESSPEVWHRVNEIPSALLWERRCKQRARLVDYVRQNFSHNLGLNPAEILDPNALTIGFARRFATYKRATLILSDRERITRLLRDSSRPIQIVYSGKAHPKDFEGKKLIQEILEFARSESTRGRVVFLSDYDITTAKHIVQGVDVWLNNPQRPLEACGTSGMKVLANGGLNLSVLDGWWDEAYSPSDGWAIGTGRELEDHQAQNKLDSDSLYNVLENQVIPEFYERVEGIPIRWMEKVKHSISELSPRFSSRRMVTEYAQRFYFKDGPHAHKLNRSELGVELLEGVATNWEDF